MLSHSSCPPPLQPQQVAVFILPRVVTKRSRLNIVSSAAVGSCLEAALEFVWYLLVYCSEAMSCIQTYDERSISPGSWS